jgi:hypothetical protein
MHHVFLKPAMPPIGMRDERSCGPADFAECVAGEVGGAAGAYPELAALGLLSPVIVGSVLGPPPRGRQLGPVGLNYGS